MAANSKIEWTDHTFNPWTGCQKVSPGCDHCYAEGWAVRSGHVQWGPHAERRRTAAATWAQPPKWNAEAKAAGRRALVFCASLADVFDNRVDPQWRVDLFDLIEETDELTWMLLTKRPQNIVPMLKGRSLPFNVALGTSICTPDEAERNAAALTAAADRLSPRFAFVSAEPLLGDIAPQLEPWLSHPKGSGISQVFCGGESGPGSRPMHPGWARHLNDVCGDTGARFLFKQWGDWLPEGQLDADRFQWAPGNDGRVHWWEAEPPYGEPLPEDACSVRIGKQRAGRLLDGRLHDARPVA